jgi:hypothetical protein
VVCSGSGSVTTPSAGEQWAGLRLLPLAYPLTEPARVRKSSVVRTVLVAHGLAILGRLT